jgi:hypothetical protein
MQSCRLRTRANLMVNPLNDVRPVYTIDAADRIVFVNAAWRQFNRHERTLGLSLPELVGRSLWDLMPGGQIRQLWEVLYERVRRVGAPLFVPMRVDTPSQRRLIDIELRPLADRTIQHVCDLVWTEMRAAVALLDPDYPRDERILRQCVWCKRVQVRIGAWEEIEDARRMLEIEAGATLPRIDTVACATCKQSLLQTFPARVA